MRRTGPYMFISLLFMALLFGSGTAFGGTPTEEIRNTTDRIRAVLTDSAISDEAKKERIHEIALSRFDFPEITKRVLGIYWKRYASREQEFTPLFIKILERVYLSKINSEEFKDVQFTYRRERSDGRIAEVNVEIRLPNGKRYSIDYRMHRARDEWKIYDVLIEGISLVGNYRAQFKAILAKESFDELLQRIREVITKP